MKKIKNVEWTYYIGENVEFDEHKIGKWMYFFKINDNLERVDNICSEAVKKGIVQESKHTNFDIIKINPSTKSGVCCFYLNCDDIEGHKRVIKYFMEHNMIQQTKSGRYHNISFKLDDQTRAAQYGTDFKGIIKLEQFIDLNTGEWK